MWKRKPSWPRRPCRHWKRIRRTVDERGARASASAHRFFLVQGGFLMKFRSRPILAALCGTLVLGTFLIAAEPACAADDATAQAVQAKPNWYPKRADLNLVKQHAVVPKSDGVTIVDARPTARKYDLGHIPTAVNIPDSQFDKIAPTLLPQDKSQLVIFYCDGPECALSHNSAFKAEKLGYTNVRVYAEGFPEWVQAGNV